MILIRGAVVAVLIVGLSAAVAWAGGAGAGGGGGGQGKKSSGPGPMQGGGSKSGLIQSAPGGKGEGAKVDQGGKAEQSGKGEQAADDVKRAGDQAAPVSGQASQGAGDVERLLTDLQGLRDRRIISDDEYQRYRRQVLDGFVRPGAASFPR